MATPQQPAKAREPAQYRLTSRAYIHDVLHDEGATVYYDGIPGPHMEPLNDAAIAMVEKHPSVFTDPIRSLTVVGPGAEVLQPFRPGG